MEIIKLVSLSRIMYIMLGSSQLLLGVMRYQSGTSDNLEMYSYLFYLFHLAVGIASLGLAFVFWWKWDMKIIEGKLCESGKFKFLVSDVTNVHQSWTGKITFEFCDRDDFTTWWNYTKSGYSKVRAEIEKQRNFQQ